MKTNSDYLLPQLSWKEYEKLFKAFVEEEESAIGDDYEFLKQLGFIESEKFEGGLTELGQSYYDTLFIRSDKSTADKLLASAFLKYPPAEAILQLLHGVNGATRDNALSVLKSRGFWCYVDETPLTHLLLILNQIGLVTYSKKTRSLRILHNVHDVRQEIPKNIYIDPSTPFSNKEWLRRILAECDGQILWLDKHFVKKGLSYIWEIADGNKVKEITIISLALDEHNKNTVSEYRDFKAELSGKGILLNWLIIKKEDIRDNHDRWIITQSRAWNLPDVNTVASGNRSEIHESSNSGELRKVFADYRKKTIEIGTGN